jgi:protease-4
VSETQKPGLIRRLFSGFWWLLDQSRRLTVNLVFLLLVVIVISAILADHPRLKERTALVIAPQGALVEQFSSDPSSRAIARAMGEEINEVQLRDLLRAIEAARDDDNIERIVLRVDGLTSAGLAALREVTAALRDFRESGKEIIAYADGMDQRQYLLAATANEVYLHPSGALVMEGLRVQIGRRALHPRCALARGHGSRPLLDGRSVAAPSGRDRRGAWSGRRGYRSRHR